MDRTVFLRRYWNYYTKLEQDCIHLSQYVAFQECNLPTCSNEIIGQLLNVGAEFDHFCKVVCSIPLDQRATISQYASHLLRDIDNLQQIKIHIQGTDIDLSPFVNWNQTNACKLFWWEAYNEVKHNRSEHYEDGNLKNLLNALAALYFLEMYYVRKLAQTSGDENALDVPVSASQLFRIVGWKTKYFILGYNTYTDGSEDLDDIL